MNFNEENLEKLILDGVVEFAGLDEDGEMLYAFAKDLEEKGYAKIDGAAVRNYIIPLDMPEELAEVATSSGILGGTLSIDEKYIFLEKHEGKDVAAYAAV